PFLNRKKTSGNTPGGFSLVKRFLSLKIISDSPLGMNIFWIAGHCLDLLSQTADMYIYCPDISRIFISPHQIQQILSAVYFVGIFCQKLKKIKFLGSKI